MTGFELVFITDPALSDKELESLNKNIKMTLSKSDGKLVHEYFWGHRRLAYEIEGNDFGVYHTLYFTGSGETVDELQRQFGYTDNVLRHQIVKVDDLDTEAAFMQSLIPPKEEKIGKESSEEIAKSNKEIEEGNILVNSEDKKLDEEEQIENVIQSDTEKGESNSVSQEDDSESI